VSPGPRTRAGLEIVATILVIVVAATMLYQLWRVGGQPGLAAPAPTASARRSPPPAPLPAEPLSLEDATVVGSRQARVAVVEFSDFACPFCGRFAQETLPGLRRKYIDTGQVLFAFRHLPLEAIHPLAFKAAEAAECAGLQRNFWAMHNRLFENPKALDEGSLREHAAAIGLAVDPFLACLKGQMAERVRSDAALARTLQVSGTPTFFIGTVGADRRVTAVERLSGAQPLTAFSATIDRLLGESRLP
jgi:protein-disulfide isomerase